MEERDNFYLTKEGLVHIKKEYEELRKIRQAKVKNDVPSLFESEDLNPDYTAFQEDLNLIETRLNELELIIDHACLIKKPSSDSTVDLGARLDMMIDGIKTEYAIVGTSEADPLKGKISNESPVGKALIGHKEGDEIIISFPKRTVYKIRKIYYS